MTYPCAWKPDPLGFRDAKPFPHVIIDGLIRPGRIQEINAEWPVEGWQWHQHEHSAKRANHWRPGFGGTTRDLIDELNGDSMMAALAALTGIEGLRADASLAGGGLHETFTGGFLNMHADFNIHPQTRLHRRLNLLLYLNEGWLPEWRGELMLGLQSLQGIEPIAGRVVIFATTDYSFHGHPAPLACPPDRSRRSLALYYYSADRPAAEMSPEHSTLYRDTSART